MTMHLHGPVSNVQRIQWLDGLTAGKLREIGESIDLYQSGGIRSAMALVRTEFGRKQMDEIREVVSGLQIEEGLAVAAAVQSWRRELWVGRWLIIAATALAMLLVIVAALLVMRDVRRRREHARQLEEHNAELDAQVRSRTEALSNLSSELQRVSEREKRALARELHDELGSLLIAAKMDVSWLRKRLPADDPDVALRWNRVLAGLDEGRRSEATGRRASPPDAARQPGTDPGAQVGAGAVLRARRDALRRAVSGGGAPPDGRRVDRRVPRRAGIADQYRASFRSERVSSWRSTSPVGTWCCGSATMARASRRTACRTWSALTASPACGTA